MGKHAYLIIAHNKFEQLKMLCEMLDFEQNDIYMHIDAHVTDFDADSFRPSLRHSKMKFAERTRVNWGGYSQIQAELNLLKAAANSGEDYSYYHLLSGADLPLRPAQEIWVLSFAAGKGGQTDRMAVLYGARPCGDAEAASG